MQAERCFAYSASLVCKGCPPWQSPQTPPKRLLLEPPESRSTYHAHSFAQASPCPAPTPGAHSCRTRPRMTCRFWKTLRSGKLSGHAEMYR